MLAFVSWTFFVPPNGQNRNVESFVEVDDAAYDTAHAVSPLNLPSDQAEAKYHRLHRTNTDSFTYDPTPDPNGTEYSFQIGSINADSIRFINDITTEFGKRITNLSVFIIAHTDNPENHFTTELHDAYNIILNNLDFKTVDYRRFPLTKILNNLPEKSSLFETILVSINDKLVELFLDNKIKYTDISKKMHNILRLKNLKKYKMTSVKNINEIIKINRETKSKVEQIIKN